MATPFSEKPVQVRRAIVEDDVVALSAMGHHGAIRSNIVQERKRREEDADRERILMELEARAREAHEDQVGIDDTEIGQQYVPEDERPMVIEETPAIPAGLSKRALAFLTLAARKASERSGHHVSTDILAALWKSQQHHDRNVRGFGKSLAAAMKDVGIAPSERADYGAAIFELNRLGIKPPHARRAASRRGADLARKASPGQAKGATRKPRRLI